MFSYTYYIDLQIHFENDINRSSIYESLNGGSI